MTRLYQACLQPANGDSSHVRITIYVGTCSSWFLKPPGAKDNGREERSAGSVRIAKEMRGKDYEKRRMDRWTCSIRRSQGVPQSPPAYRFRKPTRGWSLSVFPISFLVMFFSLYERRHENTQALARELPPGGRLLPCGWLSRAGV